MGSHSPSAGYPTQAFLWLGRVSDILICRFVSGHNFQPCREPRTQTRARRQSAPALSHALQPLQRVRIPAYQKQQGGGLRIGLGPSLLPFLQRPLVDP